MASLPWDAAAFDQAFEFMGLLDLEGRLLAANRTALTFIDQPASAVLGRFFWDTPWWQHAPQAQEVLKQAVREAAAGRLFRAEVTHPAPTGELAVVDFSLSPVRDADGVVRWLIPEGRDITAFAHQRDALAQAEAKFRTLFLRSRDGLLLLEGDRFTDCNPAVLEMMRCTEPEFLQMHPWELSPPTQPDGRDSQEKALEMIRLAHSTGVHRFEWMHLRADGEPFPVEVTLIPIPLDGRQVLYTTWRDITERKAAEASLVASEDRFRQVVELTGQVVYDRDVQGDQILWEGAVEALTGFPPSWFQAGGVEAWRGRIHEEDQREARGCFARAEAEGGPYEIEYRFRHADGSLRHLIDHGTVLKGPGGRDRSLGAIADISRLRATEQERLDLERRVLHAQKLESLGVLAGGIAHDFNNLLAAMTGHLALAQEHLPPAHPSLEPLGELEKALHKAAVLTRQMLAYSGRGRFEVGPRDLNALVREIHTLMAASISKKIAMELHLDPALPAVEGDAAQLQQVVLNLVTNAADAIGEAPGRITLRTQCLQLDEATLQRDFAESDLLPGRHALLEVEDTGCGMSPEVLARIFEPFYTTKHTGRGLGLSALLGILRGHHAGLQIHSTLGEGSRFRIAFPALAADLRPPAPETAPPPAHLSGRILVVDDEEALREVARRALAPMGLEVLTAADGKEALDCVTREGEGLDLVLLDLTMPRVDGREALKGIRALLPTLPVVLCSGFSAEEAPVDDPALWFLQKPYTLRALRQTIAQALQSRT